MIPDKKRKELIKKTVAILKKSDGFVIISKKDNEKLDTGIIGLTHSDTAECILNFTFNEFNEEQILHMIDCLKVKMKESKPGKHINEGYIH